MKYGKMRKLHDVEEDFGALGIEAAKMVDV